MSSLLSRFFITLSVFAVSFLVVASHSSAGTIYTAAGIGNGDGFAASSAIFSSTKGVVFDSNGNLYVADYAGHRIRKIDTAGIITTIAGLGSYGYSGDGDQATSAKLNYPNDVAVDSDGNIYALSHRHRKVLKIDVVKKKYFLIGDFIQSSHRFDGWGDAVVGSDRCIYWPPFNANRTVQFDILTQSVSLVGDDFGNKYFKWWGGALSPGDGAIYCIPSSAKQVLSIDPLKEFSMNLKASMEEHPEKLGFLFKMKKGATACDSAIARYGKERVFRA